MQCRQSLRLPVCEREQRKEAYREGMWDQRRVGLFFRTGDIIACLSADGRDQAESELHRGKRGRLHAQRP